MSNHRLGRQTKPLAGMKPVLLQFNLNRIDPELGQSGSMFWCSLLQINASEVHEPLFEHNLKISEQVRI